MNSKQLSVPVRRPVSPHTPLGGSRAVPWKRTAVVLAGLAALAVYLRPGLAAPHAYWPLRDVHVYWWGGQQAAHGAALYAPGARYSFTYPPFAAALFTITAHAPEGALAAVFTVASTGALAVLCALSLGAAGVRRRPETVFAVTALALLTCPVAYTLHLGEVNLILAALAATDLLRRHDGHWWQGIATGLAAGIKLTPLIFIGYLLITRRVRAAAAVLSLGASAVLVVRLERLCARLGLPEALLGLVAALAADTPEVTSAVTALARGQHEIGTGVILGSNVFNLAALIGLGAVVAGGITLHRRVVIFEGIVALWIAALAIAAVTGLITPAAALVLALAVLAPYVYVSAVPLSGRSALPLPPRLRSWLAGAVAEEEQGLAGALHAGKGGPRDAAVAVLALAVVVAASAAMEGTASALGTRWAVPGVITGAIVLAAVTSLPNAVAAVFLARRGRAAATLSEAFNSNTLNVLAGLLIPAVIIASPGLGGALRTAVWYGVLTTATIALALAGRGINRRSGTLIIAAYLVFAITVIVKALPPGA